MQQDSFISRKKIFNATVIVILAILLSKISGLVRDQIMAGYFGISYDTDAFTWAYFIPNLFKVLIAESLIVAAFIPIYSSYLSSPDKKGKSVCKFGGQYNGNSFFDYIHINIYIFPQIGLLLSNIADNQMDIGKFVVMSRIMIFSLLSLGLSGLVTGILNSHNLFALPSIAPLVMNIATILAVILISGQLGIVSMAVGVMVGSVLHLAIQLPRLKVSNLRYGFDLNLRHPAVKEIFGLMLPILLSLGAVQLNNSVDNFFALGLGAGNTTALTLSWRVANLPLGVFSVAVITVLYPLFSRQAAADDASGLKESFSLGVREIGYIMLPATVGLVLMSQPIIKVLFEHYNFLAQDTQKVSYILIFHSLGLIFFGLLMILNRVFYAFKDVRTPLKVAAVSMVVNFFLDWLLIRFMDVGGLALSTSLVALFNTVILLIILRKRVGNLGGKRIAKSYAKMFFASVIMGLCVFGLWRLIEGYAFQGLGQLIGSLALTIGSAAAVYIALTYIFRMDEIKFALDLVKKFKDRGFRT
ncbi:MAG: murein biosynthesis integral membrane protein MurJ [Actinomycetota bacterium]|nr:murein biosynthesis integral membrane protein MurJ [Actinomycetota bacterium]